MLVAFSNDADTEYEHCVKHIHCKHDDQSVKELSPAERKEVMKCRIERHLKCSQPDENIVIDPVRDYFVKRGYEVTKP